MSERSDINSWFVIPEGSDFEPSGHFETVHSDGLIFGRCTDGRFLNDRCLAVTDSHVVLIDGILLNKSSLYSDTETSNVLDLFLELLGREPIDAVLARLKGPFTGAVLDRAKNNLHIFPNQTGDTAVFSYSATPNPYISNSFDLLMRVLDADGLTTTFDEHAAQMMLSYGFMLDDHTFAQEVKRVSPGQRREFNLGSTAPETNNEYWKISLNSVEVPESLDKVIESMDLLFRQAVRECFEKDLEYGYERHLADLSGGLDARMVNVVARELGFENLTNLTYSESNSSERKYSFELAAQLGNDLIFHPLDGGRCLLNPKSNLRLNGGMGYYGGITGGRYLLQALNFSEFGLEHTGQLGDVVIGSFLTSPQRQAAEVGQGGYSRVNVYSPTASVDTLDEELFLMNTRGFRGALSTHLLRQHFTYAVSPFLDIDLIAFMFSIPLEYRVRHRLYGAWLSAKYPLALNVPSTRRLRAESTAIGHALRSIKAVVSKLASKAERVLSDIGMPGSEFLGGLRNDMNPAEYWYRKNSDVRALLDSFEQRSHQVSCSATLSDSLARSFGPNATVWDKLLAGTVTTMNELYFSREKNATYEI